MPRLLVVLSLDFLGYFSGFVFLSVRLGVGLVAAPLRYLQVYWGVLLVQVLDCLSSLVNLRQVVLVHLLGQLLGILLLGFRFHTSHPGKRLHRNSIYVVDVAHGMPSLDIDGRGEDVGGRSIHYRIVSELLLLLGLGLVGGRPHLGREVELARFEIALEVGRLVLLLVETHPWLGHSPLLRVLDRSLRLRVALQLLVHPYECELAVLVGEQGSSPWRLLVGGEVKLGSHFFGSSVVIVAIDVPSLLSEASTCLGSQLDVVLHLRSGPIFVIGLQEIVGAADRAEGLVLVAGTSLILLEALEVELRSGLPVLPDAAQVGGQVLEITFYFFRVLVRFLLLSLVSSRCFFDQRHLQLLLLL
mmetsp:Transcript_1923/g.2738  ORF Transcript_1923/g.2738 Transcript_1923/m.2738 type:complete len:358 (+) Transcript_1923:3008-4081(+)